MRIFCSKLNGLAQSILLDCNNLKNRGGIKTEEVLFRKKKGGGLNVSHKKSKSDFLNLK